MTKLKFLIFLLFVSALLAVTVSANTVDSIHIDVTLFENGDAELVQTWTGSFNEGTENYIVIGNLEGIDIESFKVSDETGEYKEKKFWNIDASRLDKAGRFGIIEKRDSYELCWGIGEYGSHTYRISYTLTDFLASYTDRDGSNFMYVNPGMNTFPTNVTFSLVLADGKAIDDSVADVWGFGFKGEVGFDGRGIFARTLSPLSGNNYFVVMFSLEKGIVSPERCFDHSFDKARDKAFEGSDYSDPDEGIWIVYVMMGIVGISAVTAVIRTLRIKAERRKFAKSAPYFREAPNKGKLQVTYYLGRKFGICKDEGAIIGAMIMQMMNDGDIVCETERSVGFLGREKETQEIGLVSRPDASHYDLLYDIMKLAAGDDGALQEKELEKYSSKNYEKLRRFIKSVSDDGENIFCARKGFKTGISSRIGGLSEEGKGELAEVFGLKRYLEEFTLIDERGVQEITVWRDYLVYATLFGIADKVLGQLKEMYPDSIPELEEYTVRVNMSGVYYRSLYRSMHSAEQRARSSGSGGSSSFGGGGGFSGGGFGGGSR